jgi:hypothetical protein
MVCAHVGCALTVAALTCTILGPPCLPWGRVGLRFPAADSLAKGATSADRDARTQALCIHHQGIATRNLYVKGNTLEVFPACALLRR